MVKTPDTVGIRVEHLEDNSFPGAFKFADAGQSGEHKCCYLLYACPCGCGSIGALQIRQEKSKPVYPDKPCWKWDGEMDKPTLSPSILHRELDSEGKRIGEHWHGFLKNGIWRSV